MYIFGIETSTVGILIFYVSNADTPRKLVKHLFNKIILISTLKKIKK